MPSMHRLGVLLCLWTSACVFEPLSQHTEGIAVAGPWNPSATTRSIARTQYVTVVEPPTVAPLGRCTSSNAFACSCTHPACMPALPGTRELDAYLRRRFTYLRAGGLYCCRQNSATTSTPVLSVHAVGRAIDLMVPMAGGDADNSLGDPVAAFLVENAEYIGVQRVVWDRAFWNGERGFGSLGTNSLPHTDHVHIELSVAGAARQTPFFTSGAATNPTCTARCDGTRLINANCTSVDCAAMGTTCLSDGTPRCGTPPPPEPEQATAVPGAALPSVRTLTMPSRLNFVSPTRLFDTRSAGTRLVRPAGAPAMLTPMANGIFRQWNPGELPANANAVWFNLAAVADQNDGFVTAFPSGQPRPDTSNVNFQRGGVRANAAALVLGDSSGVTFETFAPVHLIGDYYGAFAPTGNGLTLHGPTRVLDTRTGSVRIMGNTPVPIALSAPAGATGVVGTLAVISGAIPGFVSIFPCGTAIPETSNLNFAANAVTANAVVSALGGGQVCLRATTEVEAIFDVTGYFSPGGALAYTAVSPQRILDTRSPTSLFTNRLAARQVLELPIQRLPGVPANVAAVTANLTVVSAAGPGFLTAFPCGRAVPPTSSMNFPAEQAVGSLTVAGVGGGSLCVFTSTRAHLIVDLFGVWTSSTPVTPVDAGTDPVDNGDDLHPEPDAGMNADSAVETSVSRDASTEASTDALIDVVEDSDPQDSAAQDAMQRRDVIVMSDGARTPTTGGCGCAVPSRSSPLSTKALSVFALLALRQRRTRTPNKRS